LMAAERAAHVSATLACAAAMRFSSALIVGSQIRDAL
jgi:hypothetical protein